jgi:predicted Rdx family selenoprotein
VAAQIVAGYNREVAVALTPVGEGRFEIYLNGDEVYNRKNLPASSKPGADVRAVVVDVAEVVRGKLLTALKAEAPAGGH